MLIKLAANNKQWGSTLERHKVQVSHMDVLHQFQISGFHKRKSWEASPLNIRKIKKGKQFLKNPVQIANDGGSKPPEFSLSL